MGERKVVNKYIPADFDPRLIPRGTKLSKKDGTVPVRMMLPFSVQCETCHTFLYRGRKFNSKKEAMGGPDGRYLGIQRWRFYIKCTHCARTISFLTDPKNADYEMESGGTRNYEVYKDKAKTEEKFAEDQVEEEKQDMMKALENRVLDSQREMADLDNLEEIKAMNRRHIHLLASSGEGFDADAKAVMAAREAKEEKVLADMENDLNENGITEEEEAMIKSISFGTRSRRDQVVRLGKEDEEKEEMRRRQEVRKLKEQQLASQQTATASSKKHTPLIKIKRKKKTEMKNEKGESSKKQKTTDSVSATSSDSKIDTNSSNGLASLLGGYGSNSESD